MLFPKCVCEIIYKSIKKKICVTHLLDERWLSRLVELDLVLGLAVGVLGFARVPAVELEVERRDLEVTPGTAADNLEMKKG